VKVISACFDSSQSLSLGNSPTMAASPSYYRKLNTFKGSSFLSWALVLGFVLAQLSQRNNGSSFLRRAGNAILLLIGEFVFYVSQFALGRWALH
jgi:hypothetical protein